LKLSWQRNVLKSHQVTGTNTESKTTVSETLFFSFIISADVVAGHTLLKAVLVHGTDVPSFILFTVK
jgi:hypothetical protein